jgi:hypothetical protein
MADGDQLLELARFLRPLASTTVLTDLSQWANEVDALDVHLKKGNPRTLQPLVTRSELIGLLCRGVARGLQLLVHEQGSAAAHAGDAAATDEESLLVLATLTRAAHRAFAFAEDNPVDGAVKDRMIASIDRSGELCASSVLTVLFLHALVSHMHY